MQKSFKKAIACLLAVLMVAFSVPFSALAAVGDYAPDIQLQFTPVFDSTGGNFGDGTINKNSYDSWESTGLNCAPLVYDATAGTLTAKAADMEGFIDYAEAECELIEEDVVLEEGAAFAVTVRLDNITSAWSACADIKFTDNVTPAGMWRTGNKKSNYVYGFDNSEAYPDGAKEIVVCGKPISAWSASSLYEGMNDSALGDLSEIKDAPGDLGEGWSDQIIHAQYLAENAVDVSALADENTFYNLETGEFSDDGYDYANKAIVATFLFKVIDGGPIKFELADPSSQYSDTMDGAYYIADDKDGTTAADKTTYAVNKYNLATMKNDGDTEWPGSTKMTFMGSNEFAGEVTPTHVHNYTAVVTPPTCTAKGYTTYTCQNEGCDNPSYVADYTDMIPHTEGAAVKENDIPSTCTVLGGYDSVVYCTVCNNELSRTHVDYTEYAAHTEGAAVKENDTPSTCNVLGGYDSVVYCTVCNNEVSRTHVDYTEYAAHTPAEPVEENRVEPTEESEGSYDEVVYCSVCSAEISRTPKTIPALEHTHVYTPVVTLPTCTAQGYTTYTCKCGDSYVADYTDMIPHTQGTAVKENDIPSTCTVLGGYDSVVYCTVCNNEVSRTHVDYTEYAAHTPADAVKENDIPSTCNALGGYDSVVYCTVCNNEISRTHVDYTEYAAHTPADAVDENVKPATKRTDGTKDVVVYCSVCKEELSRETVVTDKALGVTVTLAKSDIGYVDGLEAGENKLAYGTDITLTATPVAGATFTGWDINGKIVSEDATFTTKAVADVTITPVFADAAADTITVTFYDKYGNTVKQYKDMAIDAYQTAIAADFDTITVPVYPSYKFVSWDKSKDEILAINESTTIWANYEKIDEEVIAKYTVTTNADIVLPDGIVNGQIPYDTKVTVRDTAANAWKVGDAIVAYGPEYSFYVGSDVTVDPVYSSVEEKASTTVIGANIIDGSDYKVNIVATRNIPSGYTLVDYGFVYGKNLTDTELNIDLEGQLGANDNAGAVKVVHAGTKNAASNEFALNYGIKLKNAPITAKSFVIVSKGDTVEEPIYSDMFVYNY